ncbi:MAG: glycosyltransferase, partial [Pseudomonadota bacterium]
FSRFNELPAIRKGRGTIGAMMALEEAKAHREIYTLLARAARDAQAILGGEGAMLAEIAASARAEDNVKIAGHISDIEQFFKDIDLFAHPLAPHSYATSEASVHEAMYAGRPPILLAGRGPVDLIAPGLTGIVAQDENAFVEAARHLAQDGETRAKMGRAARDFATETLGPGPIAAQHRALYLEALERPRTAVAPLKARSGAQALLHAFGPESDDLLSLMGQLTRAERPVSALPLRWIAPSSGGILHYRRHYPDDRELRTWAALSFEKMGRPAMAAMERRAL